MSLTMKDYLEIFKKVYGSSEPKKRKEKIETKYSSKYDDEGMLNLRNAVVEQAAKDYIYSLKRGKLVEANGIQDLESWFRGGYYKLLTRENIDGEKVIEALRQKAVDDLLEKIQEMEEKKIKELKKQLKKSNHDKSKIVVWNNKIYSHRCQIRWIQRLGRVA